MDLKIRKIIHIGFSPPMDSQNLSFNAQASNVLVRALSNVDILAILPFRSAHDLWTKLQEKYDVSNIIVDDCIPSTFGRDELSSTSPLCYKTQGNAKVSGDDHCNVEGDPILDDPSSLYHCNASSLDLNTYSTINDPHACVDSPCIPCVKFSSKCHGDMHANSCRRDINASISSSCCVSNNVEETEESIGNDKILNGASSSSSSPSSQVSHICLMAKTSTVSHNSEAMKMKYMKKKRN
jgi:hypothetical protein